MGWIADAFSKPSNSEYRTIANFGKVENGKYWTLLGGGCGGNTVSGGFCITWTDEVKDEILSWTKEDMVNPNDPAKGLWDGILLDFEYTVWGKDAGTNLKEIAAHLKGLGVAVGLSAPGYGPKKGASCPDGLTPPCKEPYTPFGITCTAATTAPGKCPRAPLTPDQQKDPTPSLAGLSWGCLVPVLRTTSHQGGRVVRKRYLLLPGRQVQGTARPRGDLRPGGRGLCRFGLCE